MHSAGPAHAAPLTTSISADPDDFYAATPAQVAALHDFETDAIASTLDDHLRQAQTGDALRSWVRAKALAELWAEIVQTLHGPDMTAESGERGGVVHHGDATGGLGPKVMPLDGSSWSGPGYCQTPADAGRCHAGEAADQMVAGTLKPVNSRPATRRQDQRFLRMAAAEAVPE